LTEALAMKSVAFYLDARMTRRLQSAAKAKDIA
jgi:hypothetical protein